MVVYSIKDLMGLCSDYALDAQVQKVLFSLDLWVPKAAREVQIDNVSQQRYAAAAFTGFNRARSPTRNDTMNNNTINNRLRRTLALRSMSAEVFRSSNDTSNSASWSRTINTSDSNKTNTSLMKKSSNGQIQEETASTSQSQLKLMPILEGGEHEDKIIEPLANRVHTDISTMINTTTTLDWTPTENESSTANRTSIDALFELSVRADSALRTALCENNALSVNANKTSASSDRLTLRKSVSVMNQKQKTGSGRSLVRAKSDMVNSEASRKRALSHIARASERYFNDDPRMIAEIEELELEYLFNYIRHLKTFPKYADMTEDQILQDVEADPHTLRQRTKEILKGKMSDSYATYLAKYPTKKQRRREHPTTPNKYRKCSRRCFDGQLRTWRRNLHQFDDDSKQETVATTIDINDNDEQASTDDQTR